MTFFWCSNFETPKNTISPTWLYATAAIQSKICCCSLIPIKCAHIHCISRTPWGPPKHIIIIPSRIALLQCEWPHSITRDHVTIDFNHPSTHPAPVDIDPWEESWVATFLITKRMMHEETIDESFDRNRWHSLALFPSIHWLLRLWYDHPAISVEKHNKRKKSRRNVGQKKRRFPFEKIRFSAKSKISDTYRCIIISYYVQIKAAIKNIATMHIMLYPRCIIMCFCLLFPFFPLFTPTTWLTLTTKSSSFH